MPNELQATTLELVFQFRSIKTVGAWMVHPAAEHGMLQETDQAFCHQEGSSRTQHARHFLHRTTPILYMVQNLQGQDGVVASIGGGNGGCFALP